MNGIRVVNLTPHDIDIVSSDGAVLTTFPASGDIARCAQEYRTNGELLPGIVLGRLTYGTVEGLPPPTPSVRFLVSLLVKLACPERRDLLVVADEVRDARGRVIGCRGLADAVSTGSVQ